MVKRVKFNFYDAMTPVTKVDVAEKKTNIRKKGTRQKWGFIKFFPLHLLTFQVVPSQVIELRKVV